MHKSSNEKSAAATASMHPIWRTCSLFANHIREAVILVALIIVAIACDIFIPFINQHLIDRLIVFFKEGGSAPMNVLLLATGGILLLTLASRFLRSSYNYRLFTLVTTTEDETRARVFRKYLDLHVLFHQGSSSGQIIARIERGGSAIYAILHDICGQNLVPPLIIFVGVLTVIASKNWLIALFVFLPLPIYIIAVWGISKKIYEIEKDSNDRFEAVSKESYDAAGNILTVKKFSQEGSETAEQKRLMAEARRVQYGAERLWMLMENIQTAISMTGRIAVILASGFVVFSGKATIGEFVLYITLQNMAYSPLAELSHIFPRLRRNMARLERLFEILDEPILVTDAPDAIALPAHASSIEFKEVWFRYAKGRRWALQNVNLTIEAGSTVALVGRSGSGKTTFINLLLRSFDPQKGAIAIDDHNIRAVTRESMLGQMAVVPQEVDLFSRSILANIAYGKPDVTEEQVITATRAALAHEFIMATDNGYETLVGERGIRLSGGERQRVGIARAILRDPSILIFDEATSHLDTESERLIAGATENLMRGRTTIIIAHRLSTVLKADKIVVFKNGEIEAIGPHEELLRTSPTYERLHSLQFADPTTDNAEEPPAPDTETE